MADYYPLPSFHFQVTFSDIDNKEHDIKFQSVSGLNAEMETETFKEGGENRFEHVFPGRSKFSDLSLKRGVIPPGDSAVTDWCLDALQNQMVKPISLQVVLLNQDHQPLMVWDITHAWPKSLKYGDLSADKSEVFIETMDLVYNRFKVSKP